MAMPQPTAPPDEGESPHFAGQPPIVFEGFSTLNTDASREGIESDQMAWCDGWMPLGKNNLRTLYGVGPILYTAPAGLTIACYYFGNIESNPWMIVFLSDGSIVGVNTNSLSAVPIAPPGTIQSPSVNQVGVSQWASEIILIVSNQNNGYWFWNGSILTGAGTVSPFVVMTNDGVGYSPNPTITITGGSGSGATFQAVVQNGLIIAINVLTPGTGFLPGDVLTVVITDPTGSGATADLAVMVWGVQGTTVEVYSDHVWVATPATASAPCSITFSAPGNPGDFATSDGGGNFELTDSFTRVNCTRLVQNNGFLWLVCDSSISYISNVNTQGTPPTTTFTKQNANPEVGTPWPAAVQTFGQYLVLGNPFGVHVQTGGSIDKISEPLDGFYNSVPNFGGVSPSTAKAIIFGKKAWMMLLPVVNTVTGLIENKLLMWAGKGWWTSQQDIDLVYIAGQEINSVQTAYGTEGTRIFPLFQQPSVGFSKTVQSKLFSEPGGYMNVKAASRLWGLAQYYSPESPSLTISVDNELGSSGGSSKVTIPGQKLVVWHTASGAEMIWTTAGGVVMSWSISGFGPTVFPPTAIGQDGVLLGLTVTTVAADVALVSLMLGAVIATYRG
jgi:hypothetical protein